MFFGSNENEKICLRNLPTFTHNVIIISNARFLMTNVHTCQESVNITGKHIFISLRPQKCVMCIYGNRWAKFTAVQSQNNISRSSAENYGQGKKLLPSLARLADLSCWRLKKPAWNFNFLSFFAILASKGNTPTLWLKLLLVLGKSRVKQISCWPNLC